MTYRWTTLEDTFRLKTAGLSEEKKELVMNEIVVVL